MQTKSEPKQELFSETILPITVRIELERHGGEDGCSKTIDVQCHFYRFGNANDIDFYVVDAGRMRIFASYNGVLSVEEV